ncbi:MAG: ATP-binding protein [Anaerolineales bacterium]|nr:ATP-binding protein [Anaerolineales bacterium]
MRIVVASGKGGTGKTTIATSLALVAAEQDAVRFMDCDVEAPNAALFLDPIFEARKEVGILIPQVDEAACTFCGKCAEVCQFHAIAVIGQKTLVFPELCHGCGSCTLVCPEHAISEKLDVLGVLEGGPTAQGIDFAQGVMNIGEPMAVPIIRELKKWQPMSLRGAVFPEAISSKASRDAFALRARNDSIEIRDAPPGASCPVVETIRGTDFVLLVTEPTPFGLHDLKQVVGIARELGLPAGVVINRDGIGDNAVDAYCAEAGLPILMRIPMERRFAEGVAQGKTLIQIEPEYAAQFQQVLAQIQTQLHTAGGLQATEKAQCGKKGKLETFHP